PAGSATDPVTFGINTEAPELTRTATTLSASTTTAYRGERVTLTASATDAGSGAAVSGEIAFTAGSRVLGTVATDSNGTASLAVSDLPVGEHGIAASLTPSDPRYSGSSSSPLTVSIIEKTDGRAVVGSMQWGVKESFRNYVVGPVANGKISASKGASQAKDNGVFTYLQAKSGTRWNGETGSVQYAGNVNFRGHDGVMDVNIANPTIRVLSASKAEILVPSGSRGSSVALATIDLASAKRERLAGDAVRFAGADVTLTSDGATKIFANDSGQGPAGTFYNPGDALDRISFTIGEPSGYDIADPPAPAPTPKPAPEPRPAPAPVLSGPAAGSLSWGVSARFAAYTTCEGKEGFGISHCAKGSISTSGVGAGYLFPQAAGSSWDRSTQTGTVNYSGTVSFSGYGMTMFNVTNPSITVTGPTSAVLNTGNSTAYGSTSYQLDLASGGKSVGANGEVTWSNVPVLGSLSSGGAGGSGNQSIGFDALTFTVGSEARVNYGSTRAGADTKPKRTPAATPPATTGITVLTDADKITAGGRIEIEASGFDADDEGVLVVLYGDGGEPMVLDEEAGADAGGVVRWSGTLPRDIEGPHTITLQGSIDAGAAIDVTDGTKKPAARAGLAANGVADDRLSAAGVLPAPGPAGTALWEWWAGALGLAAIAACTTLLAVRQRRAAE
ncbi:HtaA domain-containing protein, partial [Leucobacter sp. wl10]|uniref:HtaA domain-containing protein n=1 Tax=Leucobacter sp. wl10 TaxID=2304677 RepID=UPI000E9DCEF1